VGVGRAPNQALQQTLPGFEGSAAELGRSAAEGFRGVSVQVLALDLERTLIDDALSGRPRPGLREFLTFCGERFGRGAIYTTVEEADAREVLADLAALGFVPPALSARLEFVGWSGEYKDLVFVPGASPAEVVLVDDDAGWVRPDQRRQWVPVAAWDGGPDAELSRVRAVLESWMAGSAPEAAPGTSFLSDGESPPDVRP
jgi:hypothetical protein